MPSLGGPRRQITRTQNLTSGNGLGPEAQTINKCSHFALCDLIWVDPDGKFTRTQNLTSGNGLGPEAKTINKWSDELRGGRQRCVRGGRQRCGFITEKKKAYNTKKKSTAWFYYKQK